MAASPPIKWSQGVAPSFHTSVPVVVRFACSSCSSGRRRLCRCPVPPLPVLWFFVVFLWGGRMLGVFSGTVVSPPEELVAAGSRTPSPKTRAGELVERFLRGAAAPAVSVKVGGDDAVLAYSHVGESPLHPRSFAVKDDIFCLFEGVLDNLGRLRQHYGLSKNATEVLLVIEAYKALRDRAPYPASHMVGHLSGSFAFILFDRSTSTLFVASDPDGRVPLYWGITADAYVAFANDVNLLKGSCGKSLASFPQGCFYSTSMGLKSYENPKNKITAIPAPEEEIWGATFKVEGSAVFASMH